MTTKDKNITNKELKNVAGGNCHSQDKAYCNRCKQTMIIRPSSYSVGEWIWCPNCVKTEDTVKTCQIIGH